MDNLPALTAVARGRCAEQMAAQWLRLCRMQILDRNRRAADGEVDLVARDGQTLVFVEVRARREGALVGPAASIDAAKWRRLLNCARALSREPALRWPGRTMRLDAVLIDLASSGLRLRHLRNLRGPATYR
ncbi:YraN family protein [bacterium]|nr:MAG: YraN family protein [bacterium]